MVFAHCSRRSSCESGVQLHKPSPRSVVTDLAAQLIRQGVLDKRPVVRVGPLEDPVRFGRHAQQFKGLVLVRLVPQLDPVAGLW